MHTTPRAPHPVCHGISTASVSAPWPSNVILHRLVWLSPQRRERVIQRLADSVARYERMASVVHTIAEDTLEFERNQYFHLVLDKKSERSKSVKPRLVLPRLDQTFVL